MKYEIQYYYSASNNSTGYCKEVHGDNMPIDCVPITDEMWQIYEDGIKQGLVMQPDKDGFVMVNPDTLLTEQERIERDKQSLIAQAKGLLAASDYRVLPDRFAEFTTGQQTELVAYRAQLRLVARGESTELPTISF